MLRKYPPGNIIALLLAFLALAAALLSLCTERVTILVLESRTGEPRWVYTLPGDTFTLGFTHSVMKTPVEERYQYEAGIGLVLVETVYQSYGVGLPFLPEEGELLVEDGRFILRMRREIGRLHMVVSDIPGHWLDTGELRVPLDELPGLSPAITLYAERQLRFKRFGGVVAA